MARILLIEDDPDLRRSYTDLFRGEHYDVDAVDNGEAGLERIYDAKYDLAVVDMMLPGMDGAEFARLVRSAPVNNDLPILMISAVVPKMGFTITKDDGAWAPIDRFLDKTAPPAVLAEAVRELLSTSRVQ